MLHIHRRSALKGGFKYTKYNTVVCLKHSVEFDAYRLDLEALLKLPRDSSVTQKLGDAEARHKLYKDKYERLRADVAIKMKFLDENRVRWIFFNLHI